MPTARKHTVIPGQPGFFHCISRCVRRAWLCGTDPLSGNNFDHRRDWMLERMRLLTTCFAIDIYAYAFMDNHYHIVRPERKPVIPNSVSPKTLKVWRQRLCNISWVMRLLNEPMARIANAEDETSGHFWESRFKCNPLLDDQGLVTCMVYADLNPIKAGLALTPEASDYTSIQHRIRQLAGVDSEQSSDMAKSDLQDQTKDQAEGSVSLQPVAGSSPGRAPTISISLESYIELVEITADAFRQQRAVGTPDALRALGIKPTGWMRAMTDFVRLFRTAAGTDAAFTRFMQRTGRTRRQDAAGRRILMT